MKFLKFILISSLLFACSAKKEIVETEVAPRPNWVSSKPLSRDMYSGIGMAYKSNGADYIAIAKNNALNDLASEISVNVSSSSLFYQVENDQTLREEFQANTRLKSKENLQGYELVGNYENENEYWVYYTLDKRGYEELKQQRLANAIAQSKQFFTNALQFKEANQYAESLKFTIKAVAALKDYMGEPIQTEWQGKEVFYLVELYSFYQQTVSDINLKPLYAEIEAKRGQALSSDQLSFIAQNPKGASIAGIPIFFYYSAERIANNQLYTNTSGTVSYTLPKLVSANNKEYFQANMNMVSLVSEATEDPFIRKLLAKVSGPEARIEINVQKPKVFLNSSELNLGEFMETNPLANAFTQEFIDDGFEIAKTEMGADYILMINAKTRESGMQQKFFTTSLDATFQFTNAEQVLLYEKQIQGFTGMQLTARQAGEDAYKKLAAEIRKRYFREMRRKVFD